MADIFAILLAIPIAGIAGLIVIYLAANKNYYHRHKFGSVGAIALFAGLAILMLISPPSDSIRLVVRGYVATIFAWIVFILISVALSLDMKKKRTIS